MTVPKALELLQITAPPAPVLSVYLATTPSRVLGQGYLIAYRSACADVRSSLPPAEVDAFDASAARVERYLMESFVPTDAGLAVFAAGEVDYFFTVPLPHPPREQVAWDIRPHVEPLVAVLDQYERVAVAVFDKEQARLFTVFLGEIEEQQAFEDEVPGKQATGGWAALAQSRYARHHEEHVRRHVERIAAALTKLLRKRPFDRLLLAGPDEALAALQHELPRPLRNRLAGTLKLELFATDAEILQAVRVAADAIERREEADAVSELLDAAVTSRYVALGIEDTVAALNDGRVHVLFVAADFAAAGRECPACGLLVSSAVSCPQCGAVATSLDEYREAVVRHALAQGARIEEVGDEAAARLSDHGGIGAWTRY
jgi:peptide subunit release factor 1 (eRF1)